ncbi:MAG: adenylate/guanylate cyclase protein [Amycolatopsis sp.]|uniref:adenylate/guanylate cyclase domain-containing protein n=1 Tax=Amycolatopsis sp. TaxID=37632 RepID=UPI00260895F1|nr:adenylate/guanylate cyclase domain-containing protein [Amycolatopsis sp.]MCU1684439.1 adenylate/guanylate cyclase protein [Amycolatopsis sp.]
MLAPEEETRAPRCSACKSALPSGARFCPSCGTAVSDPPKAEKRKVVTVLFCDLVSSTALSGTLEPEMLRIVMLRYFELMRGRIEAHGGTVEKFIGDAVMAVFGVPAVHENDALRGASAGLEMIAALGELNSELTPALGCRLSVRLGINTGEVVTAANGGQQTMVSGEVVNIAARLEQHAGENQILLGPDTLAALGTAAVVAELGPMLFKGKAAAVPVHRLLGLRPEAADLPRGLDLPFVGRKSELARLRSRWDRVTGSGTCRRLTVCADAGLGKTRLLREWLDELPDADVFLGTGRCHSHGDQASLMPLATAMRQILAVAAEAGFRLDDGPAGSAYDVLSSGLLADGTPSPSLDTCRAAVAGVLAGLAAERPVVLVLDDLHWADAALLDAIELIAAKLGTSPVFLVCAGRTDLLLDHPLWTDSADAGTFELGPLTPAESATLAGQLVEVQSHGTAPPPTLLERAEGNPLYLEQLTAMLTEGAEPGDLPGTVTAVLAARIDALASEERVVLDAAAVIGRQFAPAQLSPLVDAFEPAPATDPDQRILRGLVRRRLIEPVDDDGHYRFRSGLVREVTYQGISKVRRAEWHELLATGPRTGRAVAGRHLEEAYRHRSSLGLRDERTERLRGEAARTLGEAGGVALARADLSWSESLHRSALACSVPGDPWWAATAQRLGETCLALGRTLEGGDLLREVVRMAADTGDQLAAAHGRLQLAALDPGSASGGSAAEVARAALPVFRAARDDLGLARAGIRLAQEQQSLGRNRAAHRLLADALHAAVAADAEPERALTLGAMGVSFWLGPFPAEEAIRNCRELLAEHGSGRSAVQLTINCPLASLLALRQRFDEARECLALAGELVQGLGYAEAAMVVPIFAAGVEAAAGDFETAERLLRAAISEGRKTGELSLLATASRDLARIRLARGRVPAILPTERTPSAVPAAVAADQLGIRARMEAAAGRHASAAELALHAVAEAAKTDSPVTLAVSQTDLAHVHLAAGAYRQAGAAAAAAGRTSRRKEDLVGLLGAARLAAAIRSAEQETTS